MHQLTAGFLVESTVKDPMRGSSFNYIHFIKDPNFCWLLGNFSALGLCSVVFLLLVNSKACQPAMDFTLTIRNASSRDIQQLLNLGQRRPRREVDRSGRSPLRRPHIQILSHRQQDALRNIPGDTEDDDISAREPRRAHHSPLPREDPDQHLIKKKSIKEPAPNTKHDRLQLFPEFQELPGPLDKTQNTDMMPLERAMQSWRKIWVFGTRDPAADRNAHRWYAAVTEQVGHHQDPAETGPHPQDPAETGPEVKDHPQHTGIDGNLQWSSAWRKRPIYRGDKDRCQAPLLTLMLVCLKIWINFKLIGPAFKFKGLKSPTNPSSISKLLPVLADLVCSMVFYWSMTMSRIEACVHGTILTPNTSTAIIC